MKKQFLVGVLAIILCSSFSTQKMFAEDNTDPTMFGPDTGQMSQNHKQHKMGKNGHCMDFLSKLNLTQEQKTKLDKQKEGSSAKMKEIKKQLMTEHEKLMSIEFDPKSTKEDMYKQQEKVSAIKNQIEKNRIDNLAALKEILTPEQRDQLQKQASEKMKNFKEHISRKGTPCKMKQK